MPAKTAPDLSWLGDELDQGIVLVEHNGTVAYVNRAAQLILGLDTDLAGSALSTASQFQLIKSFDTVSRTGHSETVPRVEINGRTVMLRAIPTTDGGVVLLLRDDSRLHHLETVRRDFVANVSHELRTPITAISLIVDTLNNGAIEDREAAHEFVRRIGLEVSNLGQMVEELLALSRMESEELETPARERIPVTSIVQELSRLQPLLDVKQQAVVFEVTPGTSDIVGDQKVIQQLFRNLVHNAGKYSPVGAQIEFRARNDNGSVRFEIVDHGIGIASTDLSRIFERFWKADRSRHSDGEGSGLGLAIAKHAVEVHGGTINVDSVPDHGTTFVVSLPAAP